jgi:hypothetical protein
MQPAQTTERKAAAVGLVSESKPRKPSLLCCFPVLWLFDVCALGAALYLGYWLRISSGLFGASYEINLVRLIPLAAISVGWTVIFAVEGLYRRAKVLAGLDQVLSIGKSTRVDLQYSLSLIDPCGYRKNHP